MRRFRPSLVAGAIALALCSGTASAQFSGNVIYLRRQPERRRPVRRALHDQYRASPPADVRRRRTFRHVDTPPFTGGNDLRPRRRRVNSPSPFDPAQRRRTSRSRSRSTSSLPRGRSTGTRCIRSRAAATTCSCSPARYLGRPDHARAGSGATRTVGPRPRNAGRQAASRGRAVHRCPEPLRRRHDAVCRKHWPAGDRYRSWPNCSIRRSMPRSGALGCTSSRFDTFKLQDEIIANPAKYGFVNTTSPVCTTDSSLQCTPSTLRDPNGNLTWVCSRTTYIRPPERPSILAEAISR